MATTGLTDAGIEIGMVTTGLTDAGIGIGVVFWALINIVKICLEIKYFLILGFAFSEATGLFALMMASLLLYVA